MTFSLYDLFKSSVLFINALAILNEQRFLHRCTIPFSTCSIPTYLTRPLFAYFLHSIPLSFLLPSFLLPSPYSLLSCLLASLFVYTLNYYDDVGDDQ